MAQGPDSGMDPFGSSIPQMPDVASDPNGRVATQDELQMVANWIANNCPK